MPKSPIKFPGKFKSPKKKKEEAEEEAFRVQKEEYDAEKAELDALTGKDRKKRLMELSAMPEANLSGLQREFLRASKFSNKVSPRPLFLGEYRDSPTPNQDERRIALEYSITRIPAGETTTQQIDVKIKVLKQSIIDETKLIDKHPSTPPHRIKRLNSELVQLKRQKIKIEKRAKKKVAQAKAVALATLAEADKVAKDKQLIQDVYNSKFITGQEYNIFPHGKGVYLNHKGFRSKNIKFKFNEKDEEMVIPFKNIDHWTINSEGILCGIDQKAIGGVVPMTGWTTVYDAGIARDYINSGKEVLAKEALEEDAKRVTNPLVLAMSKQYDVSDESDGSDGADEEVSGPASGGTVFEVEDGTDEEVSGPAS